jgi:hypothetical protein
MEQKKSPNKWLIALLVFVAIVAMWKLTHNNQSSRSVVDIKKVVLVTDKNYEKLSSIGSLKITGTLTNISDETIRYVKIRGFVFDAADNQIGTDWTYADSDTIPPGGSSTFTVYVDCNLSQADSASVIPEEYD